MNRVKVGHISEFPEMQGRVVRAGGLELALFRLSDGTVRAIENRCPHKGGKLSEGIVCDHHVFCPLHDWKIDLHNGQVQAPDEGSTPSIATHVDAEGYVFLALDSVQSRVS